ncbi:alpha/beta hydrolase [Paenibacillus thiaminolyticus]|uniref:alpha/beta hydrolase n=1 Tax=Paenibacillus thiaminolyticus TaxID=49283 RepID=UPI0025437DCB|nr:alpha/beta hydrolase-fold protein [Paenibacillus thiaminolyticus]WII36302.1 alpha/beta hydrolase-fold protein [Paenibacillus thiaminolyticus]
MDSSRLITIYWFYSSILANRRKIFIYLPPSYHTNEQQRYPVLYMQDGQHMFFADRKGDSWDVHRTADRLAGEGRMREIIVVAISHIEDARIAEYMHANPDGHNLFNTANQGELYEQFLVQEVKPYIDREYRTLPGKEHTALMGSSAGGLVSYNIGFRQSDTFGMIGALCPFFVSVNPATMEERWLSQVYTEKKDLKIWMDVGDAEGFTVMEKHVRQVVDTLIRIGYEPGHDLMYYYAVGSGHAQKDWAARVHAPLLYFFGDIGTPVRVELGGSGVVGVQGPQQRFNAVVHFDSGFVMTDLNARYDVSDPSIVEVTEDGTLWPKQPGKTAVTYHHYPLKAEAEVAVVPYISETAAVTIVVKVPEHTPYTDRLYAGIELPMIGEGRYGGTFEVPGGMAFEFRISRGLGMHETDRHGQEVPYRKFTVTAGLELYYEVENWVDAAAERAENR